MKDVCHVLCEELFMLDVRHSQGWINHWVNRANARDLALLGASRLNTKILLYWFFMFLGCSPRVKIVELCNYCV